MPERSVAARASEPTVDVSRAVKCGHIAFADGDYQTAIHHWDAALASCSDSSSLRPGLVRNLARCYFELGDLWPAAFLSYRVKSDDTVASLLFGLVTAQLGLLSLALPELRAAAAVPPPTTAMGDGTRLGRIAGNAAARAEAHAVAEARAAAIADGGCGLTDEIALLSSGTAAHSQPSPRCTPGGNAPERDPRVRASRVAPHCGGQLSARRQRVLRTISSVALRRLLGGRC